MKSKLEICAGDIRSVRAAAMGGAARVELCSALSEGGLTPSYGLIKEALKERGMKVNVLIRPRAGDFVYNKEELAVMKADILMARQLGANGVVFGCLTPQGKVDMTACRSLMDAAEGMSTTFHRAFDLVADPFEALENVITLGFDRILTSGLRSTALSGAKTLKALIDKADGRIVIMPGAGINRENCAEIMRLTGAHELHASAREAYDSEMIFRRDGISMGAVGADEYEMKYTSPLAVDALINEMFKAEYE